jgi:predicted component of type VI protein secretion system
MTSSSSGRRGLSFSIGGLSPGAARPRVSSGERPIVVLVATDASGRAANRLREPVAGRSSRQVDVDRLDAVVRSWNARVPVQVAGETIWLEPRSLDELHPDHLLEDVPQLMTLLALRGALGRDPNAAAQLTRLLGGASSGAGTDGGVAPGGVAPEVGAAAAPVVSSPVAAAAESSQDTLARLLGGARPSPVSATAAQPAAAPVRAGLDIDRFIRAIVGAAPAAAAPPAPDVALEAAADAEVGRRLRALLAAPAFRELEAAWRGIDGLCRNCPDEELVRTQVLDVSLEELAADPSGLSRLLVSESPDVLLCDHRFDASVPDLNVLSRLLEVCHAANVELVAGARPELAGCNHFAEVESPEDNEHVWSDDVRAAWASLCALRERGARLELVLPRFVLRQPYGAAGEPLERLRFEEVLDQNDHEALCWGNGAYLLVRALCSQHAEPTRARPDGGVEVRELPIVHMENAEHVTTKPPAESWLSERSVGKLRAAGFAVLQGVRGTDRVIVHPAG